MLLENKKIAVLGATGFIGRSLIGNAAKQGISVFAFSRDIKKAKSIFKNYGIDVDTIFPYEAFLDEYFDIVVNATGVGSPKKLSEDHSMIFSVTEEMDRMLFKYLENYPTTRVFNISSGSIYGLSANEPITDKSNAVFDLVNYNAYAVAKLVSEVKHRAAKDYFIVDLRVFAFVSRWLDSTDSFFIAEVAKSLLEKKAFYTNSSDMIRDFCTADDIWQVINFLCEIKPQNAVFDIQSRKPVSKFEVLEKLSKDFGLQYHISSEAANQSPTGYKKFYYSMSDTLSHLGFRAEKTSLQNIYNEISAFILKSSS